MTPAARVQARAIELLGAGELGLATDAQSHRGWVLVGIARPGASVVLQLPAADCDPVELAKLAGFALSTPKAGPDIEELRKLHTRRR